MKIFKNELAQNYNTSSFGYTEYAIRENKDVLADIYAKGFLPYSGTNNIKDHLYMARSVRIDLNKFKLNSENRRVFRKFENSINRIVVPVSQFDTQNPKFLSFCKKYFKEWHNMDIRGKLSNVLKSGFITDIAIYTRDATEIAYVLLVRDKKMSHYWFSFYHLDFIRQSLGMWLMINEAIEAKKEGREYMYIGTGYGKKAQYKMNFDYLEFWTGAQWSSSKNELRARVKTDESRTIHISDEWRN